MSDRPAVNLPIKGRAHVVGDHVSTDEIFPGAYLSAPDPWQLGNRCLEGLDPGLAARVEEGDVLVAGRNFARGSSREQAAVVVRACGFHAILAVSFSGIFERNAINCGLALGTISEEVYGAIQDAADVVWHPFDGRLEVQGADYPTSQIGGLMRQYVEMGGITPMVVAKLGTEAHA